MNPSTDKIIEVVIATPVRQRYDYRISVSNDLPLPRRGCRVWVPFGRQKRLAIVCDIKESSEVAESKLKYIIEVLDQKPIITSAIWRLANWSSHYYHHSLGEVVFAMLPKKLRQNHPFSLPTAVFWTATNQADVEKLGARAKKQIACLNQIISQPDGLSEKHLIEQGYSKSVISSLAQQNMLQPDHRLIPPSSSLGDSYHQTSSKAPTLTDEQQQALDTISLKDFAVYLLNGITGSGKTEVYQQLIDRVLKNGQQVLLLVPEIGLTPQSIRRFEARLGYPVLSLHSNLNDSEQYRNWAYATLKQPQLMIATRSGLFAQLPALGLIIVDEEHDASYKQQSGWRYSARDLAIVRAQQADVPIILGSATPALETIHQARSANYSELTLTQRPSRQPLPEYELLDIRKLPLQEGLSQPLIHRLRDCLNKGQQVMVFINRRGFAPVMMCHDCGWLAECPRCHSNFTYHRHTERLICHHCEAQRRLPSHCPDCQSSALGHVGLGTERIENQLRVLFPEANIARIDRDNTRKKSALTNYLNDIREGKYQILVGTQMLAKGHHFPNLALVAIVDMDAALFSSDYRATERFGQLLVQVSGRAGRDKQKGHIVLQTRQPDHPLLQHLIRHDYSGFADQLLSERRSCQWPPFAYLALLKAESPHEQNPQVFLQDLKQRLLPAAKQLEVALLGPVPAPHHKKAGKYRYQILIQSELRKNLHQLIDQLIYLIEEKKLAKSVRWSLDVDPQEMV